jgi:hypothetical protein
MGELHYALTVQIEQAARHFLDERQRGHGDSMRFGESLRCLIRRAFI